MKTIKADSIKKSVAGLCGQANFRLRPDALNALTAAYKKETVPMSLRDTVVLSFNF